MVRAGNDNELADSVEEKEAVAIGWADMGDLSDLRTRAEFKQRHRETYDDTSASRIAVNAGQIYRFVREIQEGEYVLTYLKSSRELLIGLVAGPYKYDEDVFSKEYTHIRPVKWLKRVSRDEFSGPARNSLGSSLTVFQVDDHLSEIHEVIKGTHQTSTPIKEVEEEETPPFYDEVKAQADELIADLISHLAPYDFQDLVAALLRAMGFNAISTPPGRDRGIDIVAHPDAFGFESPVIKVQVKHRSSSIGGPDLRSFLGSLRPGDKGLFVSSGGFTSDAKSAAENSREPVSLLDRDEFIQLFLKHYETLEPEYKALVPLRKIWIPTG